MKKGKLKKKCEKRKIKKNVKKGKLKKNVKKGKFEKRKIKHQLRRYLLFKKTKIKNIKKIKVLYFVFSPF